MKHEHKKPLALASLSAIALLVMAATYTATMITLTPQANPTTDAVGEIAIDTDAWGSGYDAIEYFDQTASRYLVGTTASDTPLDRQFPRFNTAGTTTWEYNTVDVTGTFSSPITSNPYSLAAADCYGGAIHYGATGEIDLPAGVAGMNIIIYNTGSFTVTIDPNGSEVIVRQGTAQSGGVSITISSGAGNFVALLFDGTQWVTYGYIGTISAGS